MGVGAGEGPVTVTKGHCAGDSAGLFLPVGLLPPARPRGRNLGCDSASGASSSCPGSPASRSLARNPGPFLLFFFSSSLRFPSQGAAQTPILMVNVEPLPNSTRPNISTPPWCARARSGFLSRLQLVLVLAGAQGVSVRVCVWAHTQGADSLQLGDFGQVWRYRVGVGVSEGELNRSVHISLLTSHFTPPPPPPPQRVCSLALGSISSLTFISGPFSKKTLPNRNRFLVRFLTSANLTFGVADLIMAAL